MTGVPNRFRDSNAVPSFRRVQFRYCGTKWVLMTGVPNRFRGSTAVPSFRRVQFRYCGTNWELDRVPSRYSKVLIRYCWGTEMSIRYCFGTEWALIRYWNCY